MKVKFKIMLAFALLAVAILATLCGFIYYFTASQQQRTFKKRLHNRALTVASLLLKFQAADYNLLSRLDSATSNLLVSENINVYNKHNERIYNFDRNHDDTVAIDTDLVNHVRSKGYLTATIYKKKLVGIYDTSGTAVVVLVSASDENGDANLNELIESLIIAFFAGTLLSIFAGWLFSRKLLKPVSKIVALVNDISSRNIEKRLPQSEINDEWNEVNITFNNLLSRLQESFDMQGRFISNASHELSTPLTAIGNQIDVILRKSRTNEEYLFVLHSVQADIQHMSALTQQLLSMARTVRGGALQTEAVRIDEIIMELPSLIKKISKDYNADIYFDELPDNEHLCMVNGNYELLLSAFKNIAENGCKYAPDRSMNISLSFVSGKIVILCSNTYESFDKAEVEDIFQPFQRGSNAGSIKGYGLGLSLTRRIILLHKGEIKAELTDPKKLLISVILPSLP